MKRSIMLFVCLVGAALPAFAIVEGKSEIGIQGGYIVFEGDNDLDNDITYGGRFGHFVTEQVSVEGSLLFGQTDIENTSQTADFFLPSVEALYHFGQSAVRPFVSVGAGVFQVNRDRSVSKNQIDMAIPYGAGVKWFFHPSFVARFDARHLIDIESGKGTNNLITTVGISWLFNLSGEPAPVKAAAPVVTKVFDADGDGVQDSLDMCPETPQGTAVDTRGCPPVVDTDGDGVNDNLDTCPGTPAGIAVDEVGCPKEEAKALPKTEWTIGGVHFESGSDKLKAGTLSELDKAIGILSANPTARIEISGHTDNTGKPAFNQTLSEKRANAVKAYLISNGIAEDRLESTGYGDTQPKADNSTPEGRAANRRIEFKILP